MLATETEAVCSVFSRILCYEILHSNGLVETASTQFESVEKFVPVVNMN